MEYLIRRPKLQFDQQSAQGCLVLLPYFAECCFPSEILATLVARSIARISYWLALTPALEGVYEMRRKSSRSQGAGRIAGLLLWNDPNKCISAEECATTQIREELVTLSAAWRALFLNLAPWKKEPSKPWRGEARTLLERIGPQEFLARLDRWAESLADQSPVKISASGAEVLKSLLWHLDLLPSNSRIRAVSAFRRVEYQRSCQKLADKVHFAVTRLVRQEPTIG